MFEAVLAVCLETNVAICRDALVPGHHAATLAACESSLPAGGDLRCVPEGPALKVTEIAPGVFVHKGRIEEPLALNRGDVSNLGFVIGENAVAVIDTGAAAWIGEALFRAIRARTDLPVSHVILTHMHPDHVLGAAIFEQMGAEIVGHAKLPRALADRQRNYLESLERLIGAEAFIGTTPPTVTQTVAGMSDIDLGARTLSLMAWPVAHTGADLTVLDAATGTLFSGDLVFDDHTPALDGSLRGWQTVLQTLMDAEITQLVPGHGGPVLDWPAGGNALARYLDVLAKDTRSAIDKGTRMGEAVTTIAQSESQSWALFDAYNPRNATVAFGELEWE